MQIQFKLIAIYVLLAAGPLAALAAPTGHPSHKCVCKRARVQPFDDSLAIRWDPCCGDSAHSTPTQSRQGSPHPHQDGIELRPLPKAHISSTSQHHEGAAAGPSTHSPYIHGAAPSRRSSVWDGAPLQPLPKAHMSSTSQHHEGAAAGPSTHSPSIHGASALSRRSSMSSTSQHHGGAAAGPSTHSPYIHGPTAPSSLWSASGTPGSSILDDAIIRRPHPLSEHQKQVVAAGETAPGVSALSLHEQHHHTAAASTSGRAHAANSKPVSIASGVTEMDFSPISRPHTPPPSAHPPATHPPPSGKGKERAH